MALQYQLTGNATTPAFTTTPALFDLSVVLGNVALGLDATGNFALSLSGTALARPDGTYVRLGSGERLLDVTPLILPGVNPMIVRLPVRPHRVARGDVVIVSDNPFSPLFVLEAAQGRIVALDPIQEELVTHVPARNLFVDMVVCAISLFDLATRFRRPPRDNRRRGRGEAPNRRPRAGEPPREEAGGAGEPP